jgi:DNA-binding SARP family transcriptional activator
MARHPVAPEAPSVPGAQGPKAGGPLTLLTLGRLEFRGEGADGAQELLRQPKRAAVLFFILLGRRGGFTTRGELLGMFWPEAERTRGRNSLRQTLSFLREALGGRVILNRGTTAVGIEPGSLDCDAVAFEARLDEGRREEALSLYHGELLPGFHVAGADVFGAWLDGRRRHLRARAAKAAWDVSAVREALGEAGEAAFWGKRALALSPFSESEVQRLLRLLDRLGDWAGAERAYQGLRTHLMRQFGAAPAPETARIIEDLRRRAESGDLPTSTRFGTRRFSSDRRRGERRRVAMPWSGPERRSGRDRRVGDRRSGFDRREMT